MRVSVMLACALLATASALVVEYEAERECPTELAMAHALSNATLHAQVYQWAHAQAVSRWEYADAAASDALVARAGLAPTDATRLVCVRVHYGSALELPEPLRSLVQLLLLPGVVALDVEKLVCQLGGNIFEDTLVRDDIVHETRIWTRMEATASALHARAPSMQHHARHRAALPSAAAASRARVAATRSGSTPA